MVEVQSSYLYRMKATELRDSAEKATDFSLRDILLEAAKCYDELAELSETSRSVLGH
jgi:hypothetical protein